MAACFVLLGVVFGAAYSFGPFFDSFEREFGASRAGVSLAFALAGILYFVVGLPAGMLADRFGPRVVVVPGVVALAAGLYAASRVQTLTQLYWAYALGLGFGVGLVYVPAIGAIQPWFVRRRGLASGLGVAGIGVGTLAVPPLAAWLIGSIGWRDTFVVLAATLGTLGMASVAFVDNRPERHGTGPDGDPLPVAGRSQAAGGPAAGRAHPASGPAGVTLGQALRRTDLWWLYGVIVLATTGQFMPFVHLVPHARDLGLTQAQGATLVGLMGLGSLSGRFAVGGFADRLGRQRSLALAMAALAGCMVLWRVADSYAALVAFALAHGTLNGIAVALYPSLVADRFGAKSVGALIGFLYTGAAFANLLGPYGAGWWYDRSGGYGGAILASAAAYALACAVLWRLPGRTA